MTAATALFRRSMPTLCCRCCLQGLGRPGYLHEPIYDAGAVVDKAADSAAAGDQAQERAGGARRRVTCRTPSRTPPWTKRTASPRTSARDPAPPASAAARTDPQGAVSASCMATCRLAWPVGRWLVQIWCRRAPPALWQQRRSADACRTLSCLATASPHRTPPELLAVPLCCAKASPSPGATCTPPARLGAPMDCTACWRHCTLEAGRTSCDKT